MIELIVGSTDTAAIARIRNAVMRWILTEPETIEHFRATMPGYRDWLALLDGDPIGVGVCARIAGMEESAAAFAVNCVLPEGEDKASERPSTGRYQRMPARSASPSLSCSASRMTWRCAICRASRLRRCESSPWPTPSPRRLSAPAS